MSLPKKGSRKLTHKEQSYRYQIVRREQNIAVIIEDISGKGQPLIAHFDRFMGKIDKAYEWGDPYQEMHPRIQLTPKTLAEVVEYALENGWVPGKPGSMLELHHMEEKVDVQLIPRKA